MMDRLLCRLGWHRKRNLISYSFGAWIECGTCGKRVYR